MVFTLLDSFDYKTIFLNLEAFDIDKLDYIYGFSYLDIACFFLFIGAMAKSAQIPLHVWLPDSMEGPTPISLLFMLQQWLQLEYLWSQGFHQYITLQMLQQILF